MRLRNLPIVVALLLTGCGTVMTQTPAFSRQFKKVKCGDDAPHYIPRVYSGVALDLWAVVNNPPGQIGAFLIMDLPFSVATDTALLPYTVVSQIRNGSYRCVPKPGDAGAAH